MRHYRFVKTGKPVFRMCLKSFLFLWRGGGILGEVREKRLTSEKKGGKVEKKRLLTDALWNGSGHEGY